MAWQDDMILMLRILINDYSDTTYTYTDELLIENLIVAAQFVNMELDFTSAYTINIMALTISPDPTLTATKDDAFTNLVILKAACILDQGKFRNGVDTAGVRAKCGPAMLDTLSRMDGFKQLLTLGPCAAYEELKLQYTFGNTTILRAILSPFVSNDWTPDALSGGGTGQWFH